MIDYDYRGPVGVVLFNHGSEPFEVKKGDRVAQLILERICMADVVEVESLSETSRGAGGFGSTGVAGNVENQEASSKRLKGGSSMDGEYLRMKKCKGIMCNKGTETDSFSLSLSHTRTLIFVNSRRRSWPEMCPAACDAE